jgi:hypothetical protein
MPLTKKGYSSFLTPMNGLMREGFSFGQMGDQGASACSQDLSG